MSRALIITGPTASGKTWLSEEIALRVGGEIINADMGQFYTPLSIGTAKPYYASSVATKGRPDLDNKPFVCHLFDIINEPEELSVTEYHARVLALVDDVTRRGKLPIIVGGSLFYIKSLFFPPYASNENFPVAKASEKSIDLTQDTKILWEMLKIIDPVRAEALHPNDRYRIERALYIWQTTGKKPSACKPVFAPAFDALVVSIEPERHVMFEKINKRTGEMIEEGWIDEVKSLMGTAWQEFLENKGLIGYKELFAWIRGGEKPEALDFVIDAIRAQTRQYAKRQMVFLNKLAQELDQFCNTVSFSIQMHKISEVSEKSVQEIIHLLKQ